MNYVQISKSKIYGIDFSGAKNACMKIWVCKAYNKGNTLHIDQYWRLADQIGRDKDTKQCFLFLKELIACDINAAFGLDFPFGLPCSLLEDKDWKTFVYNFPERFESPEEFRQTCLNITGKKEFKRLTDRENKAPFCVYNIRLFRQSFYGIRDLLHPLVRDDKACIIPLMKYDEDKPWVFEICPASILKKFGLYFRYKGKSAEAYEFREKILDILIENEFENVIPQKIRDVVLQDTEGDALDSILAAIATYRATVNFDEKQFSVNDIYKLEGQIYS